MQYSKQHQQPDPEEHDDSASVLPDAEKYDSDPGVTQHHRCSKPPAPQDPKALATFRKEILNAVTCCEAVEQNPWTGPSAHAVIGRAHKKKGHATVRAVSLPSQESCNQQFMAFEANEDSHTTYIIAFRNDQESFNSLVSTPAAAKEVNNDNPFDAHKSMWWRAATMPLQSSLPLQWRMGLRDHGHRLILTGFSVAGAVAAVATLQLLEAENDISGQICCYTFGTPLHGGQNYADCINHKWVSNFYHVMMDGDQIPGILTLISKVAENQQAKCNHVVGCIVKMLEVSARVAITAAIDSVLPGAGVIVQQVSTIDIDLVDLGKNIKSLLKAEHSCMPWPEYKFGGSLVLLYLPHMRPNSQNSGAQMKFVQLLKDGRVLEGVFSIQGKEISSNFELQKRDGLHQLQTFSQVINDLEDVRSAPAMKQQLSDRTRMDKCSQRFDNIKINDGAKDGAGRVVKTTIGAAKSTVRWCGRQPRVEDDQSSSSGYLYMLQPQFDTEKPIEVLLDKHGHITIVVNGENMVLGMHVLYMVDGKEKLRIPCVGNILPQPVGNAEDPQKAIEQLEKSLLNCPLRFITHYPKDLFSKEEDGSFIVHLAFGSKEVAANTVDIRMFDSLKEIKVAERFSTKLTSELIDLILFWGVATAQAQCTAAFYAIKDKPCDAAHINSNTIAALGIVPEGFVLLDCLLALVDTSHVPEDVLKKLPSEMRQSLRSSTSNAMRKNRKNQPADKTSTSSSMRAGVLQTARSYKNIVASAVPDTELRQTVRRTTSATKLDVIVPYFPVDNESTSSWTFSGCFKRTIERLLSQEPDMLSKKESAEKLTTSLDKDIAGPKEMVKAYLDYQFEYKEYRKDFSVEGIKKWGEDKEVAQTLTAATLIGGGSLPLVNIPIVYAGQAMKCEFLRNLGICMGAPTALVLAGMVGAAWCLTFAALTPKYMVQKRPGVMADLMRTPQTANNWVEKLEAAAIVFQCKIEPPTLSCKLEFELYKRLRTFLKDVPPQTKRFDSPTDEAFPEKSRFGLADLHQLGNFALAGALMYKIRRYLTKRKTVLSLIGSTQAGKSTLARLAFKVPSKSGPGMESRTRVLQHWTLNLPGHRNQQFTLIDFPGSTDQAASQCYIRGQLLADVLVVVISLKEINSLQAVALVEMACKARSNTNEVAVLFCFTLADTVYKDYKDVSHSTARFIDNFDHYKEELITAASKVVGNTDQMAYIRSNMHACSFKPKLQDATLPRAQELQSAKIKNVQWVKNWCEESLLAINK